MRKHLTLPTVLSVLALFVAMSGTAVAASSVLIKRNSQVAAKTISGARGPKADKKNIIAGSIGSTDLHAGAVTGAKIAAGAVGSSNLADGSVTASKLAAGSVGSTGIADGAVGASKLDLPHFQFSTTDVSGAQHAFASADGLTLGLSCQYVPNQNQIQLQLYASSSAAGAAIHGTVDGFENQGPLITGSIQANVNNYTVQTLTSDPASLSFTTSSLVGATYLTGQFTYSDSHGEVLSVLLEYGALGTGGGSATCHASGAMLPLS
jgi:hypothetical protein